jgi:hypothetical protein
MSVEDSPLGFGNWMGTELETYIFSRELQPVSVSYLQSISDIKSVSNLGLDSKITFPTNIKYKWDKSNEYSYNSNGYRSPEFVKNTDLVFSGCSFTHGDGVDESMIWGSTVANNLNVSYANLGVPGASCYQIVRNLFNYFKTYGNPKTVLCLFPDLNRFYAPHVPNLFFREPSSPELVLPKMNQGYAEYSRFTGKNAPKYVKRPYDMNSVIPEEFAVMLSIHAIHSLIDYCSSNKIQLRWSTWNPIFSDYIELNKDKISTDNYVSVKNNDWHLYKKNKNGFFYHAVEAEGNVCFEKECRTWAKCHSNLREEWPNNFDIGTDTGTRGSPKDPHWGVHRHAHIAEAFMESLK